MSNSETDSRPSSSHVIRRALTWGVIVGFAVAALSFVVMYRASQEPAYTVLSLSRALRPWHKLIWPTIEVFALFGGVTFGISFGIISLRPRFHETLRETSKEKKSI